MHLALVQHYRGVVHSLDIHPVGEQQLAPGEGSTLLPVLPWDTVPQGQEHKGLGEEHSYLQAFPGGWPRGSPHGAGLARHVSERKITL